MYCFGIVIGVFLVFLGGKKDKINPLIIFSILWTVILFLSALGLYGLDRASDRGYAVIAIGMFGFGVGYLAFSNINVKLYNGDRSYNIREKVILILSIITIGLYFIDFMKVVGYLMNGQTLAYIRALSQDSTSILYSNRSNLEIAFRTFIIQPFTLAFQVIVAMEFWNGKRKWIIIDGIIIALRLLSEGSRSLLLYLGLHLIITFVLNDKVSYYVDLYRTKEIRKYRKCVLGIMTVVAVVLIIITTISRSGERALRTTYYYFSMEPTMLSLWIENIKEYGYGLASINGLVFPVIYVLKNILKTSSYPSYWYLV